MGEPPVDVLMDETRDNANIRKSARHVPEGEDPLADDDAFGDEGQPDRPMGRS
ncbi:hypothetical protein [Rhodosalinus halophilus]|uniref:hypothetical protein n=1 Tax=Rhodosalinus halophilus TaxID=2259333 RepID=UPI0013147E43|nr:hypothetical protein [Rhodosalinus halophilus]